MKRFYIAFVAASIMIAVPGCRKGGFFKVDDSIVDPNKRPIIGHNIFQKIVGNLGDEVAANIDSPVTRRQKALSIVCDGVLLWCHFAKMAKKILQHHRIDSPQLVILSPLSLWEMGSGLQPYTLLPLPVKGVAGVLKG